MKSHQEWPKNFITLPPKVGNFAFSKLHGKMGAQLSPKSPQIIKTSTATSYSRVVINMPGKSRDQKIQIKYCHILIYTACLYYPLCENTM